MRWARSGPVVVSLVQRISPAASNTVTLIARGISDRISCAYGSNEPHGSVRSPFTVILIRTVIETACGHLRRYGGAGLCASWRNRGQGRFDLNHGPGSTGLPPFRISK